MGKIAFLFPGQGAQVPLMGLDFYNKIAVSKKVFEIASKASGLNIEKLCFTENDDLNITEFTQVALLATEVAILRAVEAMGIKADYCAGLSLGEYGALAASKIMTDYDLFSIIRKRGIYMQNAYPVGGAMMAIIGMDTAHIDVILKAIDGVVSIANDNCPGQIVITGEEVSVLKAGEKLAAYGARRCIRLNVSGPFHSALLQNASDKLKAVLEPVELNDVSIPYISNVTAKIVTDKSEIKSLLARQVCNRVRFRESIELLKNLGVDTFIEIGPGKTLAGFVKKTDKDLNVINISSVDDLDKLKELF